MKNEELLQDAIGMIGDDLIDDADRKPRRPRIIRWSAVACACLVVIVAVSVGWLWRGDEPGVEPPDVDPPVVDPPVVEPPSSNNMEFTSWGELKILYDAALAGDDEFLEKSRRLERYDMDFSIRFDAYPYYVKAKDAFWDMYGEIAERQILVPLNPTIVQLKDINVSSYSSRRVYYSLSYQIEYGEETFSLRTDPAGNYANEVATREGEPLASIDADGYSADVWAYVIRGYHYLSAYLTLDGDSYPTFRVAISRYEQDIPQELMPLFGQFRISTAKEMLTNADILDLPEFPKFNVISEYQSAGKRLVDPVFVNDYEFFSIYPDPEFESLLHDMYYKGGGWSGTREVRYRFDYALDPDTGELDLSKPVDGVITYLRDGKVAQVLCMAENNAVIDYVFDCDSVVVENFDGVDVTLYDLSKDGQPRYYAVFQIGKYYITYTKQEGEQYDMIECMDMFIREGKLLLDY